MSGRQPSGSRPRGGRPHDGSEEDSPGSPNPGQQRRQGPVPMSEAFGEQRPPRPPIQYYQPPPPPPNPFGPVGVQPNPFVPVGVQPNPFAPVGLQPNPLYAPAFAGQAPFTGQPYAPAPGPFGPAPPPMPPAQPAVNANPPPPPAVRMTTASQTMSHINDPNQNYGQLLQGKPPVNVYPPRDISISMVEICTFFPNWFQIPEVIMRAMRNGWTRKAIAKAQLNPNNQLNRANLNQAETRIQKQMSQGGNLWSGYKKTNAWSLSDATQFGRERDLTANEWQLRFEHDKSQKAMQFEHISLAQIRAQVPRARWPRGQDRLLLTQCLEFADDNPNFDLDTSHYAWIIRRQGWIDQKPGAQHDVDSLTRLNNNVADPAN